MQYFIDVFVLAAIIFVEYSKRHSDLSKFNFLKIFFKNIKLKLNYTF